MRTLGRGSGLLRIRGLSCSWGGLDVSTIHVGHLGQISLISPPFMRAVRIRSMRIQENGRSD